MALAREEKEETNINSLLFNFQKRKKCLTQFHESSQDFTVKIYISWNRKCVMWEKDFDFLYRWNRKRKSQGENSQQMQAVFRQSWKNQWVLK